MVLPVCMNLVSIEARRGHWIDHLKQVLQRFLHGCWGEKKKKSNLKSAEVASIPNS